MSFYNTTDDRDIHPTPVVGVLGLADPMPQHPPRLDQARPGDELWLFGPLRAINLAGSLLERLMFDHLGGRPTAPDADTGRGAVALAAALARDGMVRAQHDVSDGGLAVAVAEMAIRSRIGAVVGYEDWRHLFCEDPHRFIAAIPPRLSDDVADLAHRIGINGSRIGSFGGDRIVFESSDGAYEGIDLLEATAAWRGAIRSVMDGGRSDPEG